MTRLADSLRHELQRWRTDPGLRTLMLWLPLLACALVLGIFQQRTVSALPIAVVDLDQSALSRRLSAQIEAAPAVRIAQYVTTTAATRESMVRGEIYAVVEFPRHFQRDIIRGQQPKIGLLLNAQALAAAGAISSPITAVVLQAAGETSVNLRVQTGMPLPLAAAMAQPIRIEAHPLFNPGLDYAAYLGIALIAACLHCFAFVHGARTIAGESREWFGESRWRGLFGKLLALTSWWAVWGSVLLFSCFAWLDLPPVSAPGWLVAGWAVMVIAYVCLGAFFAFLLPSHIAYSCISALAGPALAFSGVTFPQGAMPLWPRLYGESLPVTSFLHLQTKLVTEQVEVVYAQPQLLQLAVMAIFALCLVCATYAWFLTRQRKGSP
ncbi:hypothetical protein Maes01_02630 [Microbulbifer aestuariivivens]|uniref:ABC-2 type transporter transmembrane domain-containing protein n=1 Tax=Microbulbifer aestuariivivens TaxID=1908308 RepID=A0ABP9WU73_9GAMM